MIIIKTQAKLFANILYEQVSSWLKVLQYLN